MFSRLRTSAVIGLAGCLLSATLQAQPGDARLSALDIRITTLESGITRVEDLTRIQRLQRAFGYYIDKGYWQEAADLFTDDGRVQYGVDGVYIGQQRIAELFNRHGGGSLTANGPGLPFGRINMHMQLQPMITVADDGQTAHGRWRDWSLLGNYQVKAEWGDAILENTYVKEDGVWKIAEMRYYLNFIAPYQGGWAALEPAPEDWSSDISRAFPPDEPVPETYPRFPEIFIPPFHYADVSPADRSAIQSGPPVVPITRPRDAIGRLETIADEHARELARIRSLRAIENLQAMYGYYIDKGLWREAARLFSEDGVWEFGQRGRYIGPERIERALHLMGPEALSPGGLQQGDLNNFPMLQPIITVSEDNSRAWGRWRSDVMLSRNGQGRWGGGVYENEYVNDDGTWKIAKQHYWVTFWGDYDEGWNAGVLPMAPASDTLPPDAPPSVEYESLPNTYVVPFHFDHPVTGQPHQELETMPEITP